MFFSGCIEKETPVAGAKNNKNTVTQAEFEFPLDAAGEAEFLNKQFGDNCYANPSCLRDQEIDDLANEFAFKRGQLILRGPKLFQENSGQWSVNEHLNIIAGEKTKTILTTNAESAFHAFNPHPNAYSFFIPKPEATAFEKPKVLFQSRLGLPPRLFDDPGFCNLIEAENFVTKSLSPWLPRLADFSPDALGTGFDPHTNSYVAETIIVCGGFDIVNSHLTLEAKTIIFYNSHFAISMDQDVASGLRIVTENLGYFGKNIIEANIVNSVTDLKGNSVPTVDISVSGDIGFAESDSSPNNRFNEHSLDIFMGGQIIPAPVAEPEEVR